MIGVFRGQSIFIRFQKKFHPLLARLKEPDHLFHAKQQFRCILAALIQPHFDYCCSVWDELGDTLATKLQKLQNRAARVVTRSSYDADAGALLTLLQLDNLSIRRKKIKAQLMFKILKGNALSYLKSLLSSHFGV